MQLNLIPGWVLDTWGIKQTSKVWYCRISEHKSVLSHTSQQACEHALLNGRERIAWAYWQMAELSPGEVRAMNLNFVRQKRKLIPCHGLITHLSVCSKAPIVSVWVAEWMLSMVQFAVLFPECQRSPSGFTVDLRFSPREPCWRRHSSLQSEYSYMCLGSTGGGDHW